MRPGDVADVVEIEGDHAAEPGVADRFLRSRQALLVQAIVVDPLLPILGHRAPGRGRLRAIVLHSSFLAIFRGPDPAAAAGENYSNAGAKRIRNFNAVKLPILLESGARPGSSRGKLFPGHALTKANSASGGRVR